MAVNMDPYLWTCNEA